MERELMVAGRRRWGGVGYLRGGGFSGRGLADYRRGLLLDGSRLLWFGGYGCWGRGERSSYRATRRWSSDCDWKRRAYAFAGSGWT